MIRAILFDFYNVWAPEKFSKYIAIAEQNSPELAREFRETINKYYLGLVNTEYIANKFKFKLNRTDIDPHEFKLDKSEISPSLIDFMRNLHSHFIKLGVLANLGTQEYDLLISLNAQYQFFEVITGPIVLGVPLLSHEALVKALQAIGEPPQSCLIVTGNVQYQQFATGFGIQTLHFEGFPKLKESLDQLLTNETEITPVI